MNTCVVGLQFGDEGKGKISSVLSDKHDIVVRYNGGANAGHTVVDKGTIYKYHLLPSGGKHRILTHGMVIDPRQLSREIQSIRKLVPDITISISDCAHVVMPWHIAADAKKGGKIGTTKRGIGPAYADKMHRWNAIRMGDLLSKLEGEKLSRFFAAEQTLYPDLSDSLYQEYVRAAKELNPYVCDTSDILRQSVSDGRNILFESANGMWLDVDFGTYPYVTSSAVGPAAIPQSCGLPNLHLDRIVGVIKAYTTRVGEGPFDSELTDSKMSSSSPVKWKGKSVTDKEIADIIRDIGNEYGTTTGRPRRIGWLDIDSIRRSIANSGTTELALMHVDTLFGFNKIGVKCNGKDIYLDGWFSITDSNLFKFVDFISKQTNVPVTMISHGPDNSDIIDH